MDFHLRQLPPRCWKRNRKHHKFRNHAPISMVYKKRVVVWILAWIRDSQTRKRPLYILSWIARISTGGGLVVVFRNCPVGAPKFPLSGRVCRRASSHLCASGAPLHLSDQGAPRTPASPGPRNIWPAMAVLTRCNCHVNHWNRKGWSKLVPKNGKCLKFTGPTK